MQNETSDWQWYLDLRKRATNGEQVGLDEIEFSVRTSNCFKFARIKTLAELLTKSPADLLSMQNFGRKSLQDTEVRLAELGVKLPGSIMAYSTIPLPERFNYTLAEALDQIKRLRSEGASRAEEISLSSYIRVLERRQKRLCENQRRQQLIDTTVASVDGNPALTKIAISGGFTQRELIVLRERSGKTLKQIRDILGLKSVEAVRSAEAKAYRKLRHPARKHLWAEIHELGLCSKVGNHCKLCNQ